MGLKGSMNTATSATASAHKGWSGAAAHVRSSRRRHSSACLIQQVRQALPISPAKHLCSQPPRRRTDDDGSHEGRVDAHAHAEQRLAEDVGACRG